MKKSSASSDNKAESARPAGEMCPSCGRFIGAVDACFYCGADSARSPAFRVLRYAAVALAFVGLFFLYMSAGGRAIPAVRIGEINPAMNFAYVSIAGTVERAPYVSIRDSRPGYISFLVSDGSGAIRVVAYREIAAAIVESNLLPEEGSRIEAAGNLSVDAGREPRLQLRSVSMLKILPGQEKDGGAVE